MRTEILGRRESDVKKYGSEGCGYMGKVVSYPGGVYEEGGALYVDLATPHCILVLGKRGTGKSYTLGVFLENFSLLPAEMRNKIAVLVVDTMSVFHSLKSPNTNAAEVERMKDFRELAPRGLDNVLIAMPRKTVEKLESTGQKPYMDRLLEFRADEVSQHMWLSLFHLSPTDPVGTLLLDVLESLRDRKRAEMDGYPDGAEHGYARHGHAGYTLSDMIQTAEKMGSDEQTRKALVALLRMAKNTGLFSEDKDGSGQSLVEGGRITILDISGLRRMGTLDMRSFVVALIAERLLHEKTVEMTVEMQKLAGLLGNSGESKEEWDLEGGGGKKKRIPLVYLVIDEAHLFLPSDGTTISSQPLIDWIKLGRHPGLSIVLATQEPSAIHDTAIRQADMVISHQITAEPDITSLSKARQSFMGKGRDLASLVSTMDSRRGLAIIFDDRTRKLEYCMIRPRLSLHTGMDATAL